MPSHTPAERLRGALARILTALNDALNKPKEGAVTLTAEQLAAGAEALAARRPELAEATQAAAQLAGPAEAPRRQVYTTGDAQTFLADTQRMAETLWAKSTGRQLSVADRDAISAYLVDNLLAEERGAPADGREEIAQQAVETQGAAIREFPERALFGQRLRASADAQLQSGLIDQETFNAIIFPATPFADVPARFRASVPVSGVATRQAELKALDVVNHFQSNIPEILRRVVDEGEVADFREAVGNLVSAQTDEDIVEGRNLFSAPESPSQIRARQRAEGAAELFTKEGNLGRAVEDLLRQSGRQADPSLLLDENEKNAATRAKRMFTEGLKQFRSEILSETPGISDEVLASQLGDFANSFVQTGQFDQLQSAVSDAFQAQKFTTLAGAEKAIADILGEAGLDSNEISSERLAQIAQQAQQAGGIDREGLVDAFPMFQREAANLEFVEGGADAITERLEGAAGFRFPDLPGRQEAAQRLADTIRFRVQRQPFTDIDQLLQGVFRSAASPGAEGFGPLRIAGEDGRVLGTPEDIDDPELRFRIQAEQDLEPADPVLREDFERLRFEPTGGGIISPMDAALLQGTPGARQRFGLGPPTVPGLPTFGNVQIPESPIGFGEITPFLREASGDNLAFLNFLFQPEQLRGLQTGFGEARRRQVTQERGRLQGIGEGFSGTLRTIEDRLRDRGEGAPGREALLTERDRLRRQIGTTSQFGRLASPSLTLPTFVRSQIGGLRERFAASPAGLREDLRLRGEAESEARRAESEAERNRGRQLRSGRTIFRRI